MAHVTLYKFHQWRALLKMLLTVLLMLLALLPAGCTPVLRPLDRQLAGVVTDPSAPLASLGVAVVARGQIIYEGYWGYRSIDNAAPQHSLAVTPATRFRVASISKVVTALGAMQLVEQGKLPLDSDISDYLGFRLRNPHYPDRPITARMLLSHTSSLRDAGFYALPLPYTLADLLTPGGVYYAGGAHFAAPAAGTDRAPGVFFNYANLNYGVLATVMEAASGERFDRYMAGHLLTPLGIDSGYTLMDLPDGALAQVATLYRKQTPTGPWVAQQDDVHSAQRPMRDYSIPGDAGPLLSLPLPDGASSRNQVQGYQVHRYTVGSNATIFAPYGGLRLSVREVARLIQLFLDDGSYGGRQLFAPGTLRQMLHEQWRYDPHTMNGDTSSGRYRAWGLGLQHTTATYDELGGDRLAANSLATFWGHRGEAYGLLGGMWFDPQRKVGIVYLIGGVGDDPYLHPGVYSSLYRWEEVIQTALLQEVEGQHLPDRSK